MTKAFDWLWCLVFFSILAVPAFGLFIDPNIKHFKHFEKRLPTAISQEQENLKGHIQNLESWFNDRIAFRFAMIEGLSRLYYRFGSSTRPEKVVVGKNGWLFAGNEWGQVIDHHRGLIDISPVALDKLERYFDKLRMGAKIRGIPFVAAVAPNKHTVHSEQLPGWITSSQVQSIRQLLGERLEAKGIQLIDLTPAVLDVKKQNQNAFLKTNTHWNSLAAYFAYKKIIHNVRSYIPGVPGLDKSEYFLKERIRNGDLAYMAQMPELKSHDIYPVPLNRELKKMVLFRGEKKLPLKPLHGFFVAPYAEIHRIVNSDIKEKTRLLFISDSFGSAVAPYLSHSFREVVRVHYDYKWKTYQSLLDTYNPDIIIFLIAERRLNGHLSLDWVTRQGDKKT